MAKGPRAPGVGTVALTLASVAAAELHAPKAVWILTAALAVAAAACAVVLWRRDRGGGAMSDERERPNVTSYNQSGGITAAEVNIHAPQPDIKGRVIDKNQRQEDGRYLSRAAI